MLKSRLELEELTLPNGITKQVNSWLAHNQVTVDVKDASDSRSTGIDLSRLNNMSKDLEDAMKMLEADEAPTPIVATNSIKGKVKTMSPKVKEESTPPPNEAYVPTSKDIRAEKAKAKKAAKLKMNEEKKAAKLKMNEEKKAAKLTKRNKPKGGKNSLLSSYDESLDSNEEVEVSMSLPPYSHNAEDLDYVESGEDGDENRDEDEEQVSPQILDTLLSKTTGSSYDYATKGKGFFQNNRRKK